MPCRGIGAIAPSLALLIGGHCGAAPVVPALERFGTDELSTRLLVAELNCTACHASGSISAKGAPSLDGAGARLQHGWLRAFLIDPHGTSPGTTMPDVFANVSAQERARQVDLLVHYLKSRTAWRAPKLARHGAPETGGLLFSRIGCAACHADPIQTTFAAEHRAAGLVSLEAVEDKYSFPALADFLHRPLHFRPGGRMPDMGLSLQQTTDIAAYLVDTLDEVENSVRAPLRPFAVDAEKAVKGEQVFRSAGCASCHSPEQARPRLDAPAYKIGAGKCRVVDYSLDEKQAEALRNAVPDKALRPDAQVDLLMATFNCYACHDRGGKGGASLLTREFFTGDESLGNEGKFPPHLTGAGAKLRTDWLAEVLGGRGRLRPYLATRMPEFDDSNVGHLPELLAKVDLQAGKGERLADGDVESGRILLGTQGGVGCISCHALGERRGLAMRGLTLSGAAERYHEAWFRRHLIDPMATRPGTLMPSFWPGGVAGNQTVLGADTEKQIAAIWAYLKAGGELPPGYPDIASGEFEIVPKDRPVVQRTTIEGIGTHAIAVGFPEGVHYVFDAQRCRLGAVWRGRFMDGYKSWFSRMEPQAEPLGTDLRVHPAAPADPSRRFRGYLLDDAGVPSFLYRDAGGDVELKLRPGEGRGFVKTVVRDGTSRESSIEW